MEQKQFKETVMIVDANYLDRVGGDFRVGLKAEMGQEIPAADLAEWIVSAAMESGVLLTPKSETQVVFVCEKGHSALRHFVPMSLLTEVDGLAFRDEQHGEFLMSVVQDEHLYEGDPLLVQSVELLLASSVVKNLVIVPDAELASAVADMVGKASGSQQIKLLTIKPLEGVGCGQLGYPLLRALGINNF